MTVLRNNYIYKVQTDGKAVRIICSPEDRSDEFFKKLKVKLSGIDPKSLSNYSNWNKLLIFLKKHAYESRHFTTLVNQLYGSGAVYRVCFADPRGFHNLEFSDESPSFASAFAFLVDLYPTKLIVCCDTQVRNPFTLSKIIPEDSLIFKPTSREILRQGGYFITVPPVRKRSIFHYLILHEIGHVELDHGEDNLKIPIQVEADDWAIQELDCFLAAEKVRIGSTK